MPVVLLAFVKSYNYLYIFYDNSIVILSGIFRVQFEIFGFVAYLCLVSFLSSILTKTN